MKKRISCLLVTFLACSVNAQADEDFSINAELSISQDDNLNRSLGDNSAIEDTFTTATLALRQAHRFGSLDYISYGAHVRYEQYSEVSGLDHAEAGVGLKYNFKPVPGFIQPVYIFSADVTLIDSATDIRDTTAYSVGLTLSSWITSTLSTRGGIAYRIKDSDSSVFDNKDTRLFINADLVLTRQLTSYITLSYLRGDVVSTLDINAPEILDVTDLKTALEFDPTFAPNQISYRFDSDTRFLTLGINYALAQKHSLDLSLRNLHSRAGGGVDYDTTQISLSYLLGF